MWAPSQEMRAAFASLFFERSANEDRQKEFGGLGAAFFSLFL
jgi:hypothetical protein